MEPGAKPSFERENTRSPIKLLTWTNCVVFYDDSFQDGTFLLFEPYLKLSHLCGWILIVLKSQAINNNKSTHACCQHQQILFCFAGTASTWNRALLQVSFTYTHHSHNSCVVNVYFSIGGAWEAHKNLNYIFPCLVHWPKSSINRGPCTIHFQDSSYLPPNNSS